MLFIHILLFIVAVIGVTKAADWFLTAAERIGLHFKLPAFVMGVILIGLGTSLPELTTSIAAIVNGESGIVLGNVLGSNLANIFIIIGVVTIVLGTIRFEKELIDIDMPLLLATTLMFGVLMIDGALSLSDGILLLAAFVAYMAYTLFYKDHDDYHKGLTRLVRAIFTNKESEKAEKTGKLSVWTWVMLIGSVAGLGLLSKLAVDNLMGIVHELNIAVGIVSFFALALGTSLPELVVSIKALKQGKGDLVVGNIIGSCMFNILLIGGVASVIAPQTIGMPQGYWMLAGVVLSVIMLVVSSITRRLHIWEGAAFLFLYVAISLQILNL